MDIKDLDLNFLQESNVDFSNFTMHDVNEKPFSLHGISYDYNQGRFCRYFDGDIDLDKKGLHYTAGETVGGRIRFSSDSPEIILVVEYPFVVCLSHMPYSGSCGFVLCKNTDDGEEFVCNMRPEIEDKNGFVRTSKIINQERKMKNYTLYLPLYNQVNKIFIGVTNGSGIGKGMPYLDVPPILYYGSSITQGGCASRSDTCYQGLICKKNNVDYMNFGFSGGALAETNMIKFLASKKCSVVVLDYDHNTPNLQHLKDTHLAMYRTFRSIQPDTPIILISKPDHTRDEMTYQRFKVINKTYKIAKEEGDKNVYFIDGRKFFGKELDICTVDGTHPTDLGFYKMAKKIGKVINNILFNK